MSCKSSTTKANNLLRQYATVIQNGNFQPAILTLSYIYQLNEVSQCFRVKGTEKWPYRSFEQILFDHGRFFKLSHSAGLKRTDIGNRFRYASNQQSSEIIYCEGIILKPDGLAFEHAWNLSVNTGEIVDAYFDASCYFGIPLTKDFVCKYNRGLGIFSPDELSNGIDLLELGLPQNAIWKKDGIPKKDNP
ncbi:MAG TPA: hypothetical protein VN456_18090 [Desulfosporosinus sp.]|nr:hypothetical protein [Desulfosporosinus sp.]